jgi:lysyl-tRNA synthetase, class II
MQYPEFFLEHKLQKRCLALSAGLDPYPYSFQHTHTVAQIIADFNALAESGAHVTCPGRILSVREMGRATFVDIIDDGKVLQAYVRANENPDAAKTLDYLDVGDLVGITGSLFTTKTGHSTINVTCLVLLAKSVADIPFGKVHAGGLRYSLSDVEVRRQKRYLDWITNPDSLERFKKRAKIISAIRSYLEKDGFLEVETPTLEPVYGGAEARPFTTEVHALGNRKMYLRVSPELYLKRYIVAGFSKVFTICSNFRNEGIDATHNPEFTMMEWYEAFTDYECQMERFERLTCYLVEQTHGSMLIRYGDRELDFTPPWPRMRVPEIILEAFGKSYECLDKAELVESILAEAGDETPMGMTSETFRHELSATSLGQLVMDGVERFLRKEDRLWRPSFLCDHPREISPLTKTKRGAPEFVERFEPYAANMEIGNAYSELTDPVEQFERFAEQRLQQDDNKKEYYDHPIDEDFLHAIACGMPPTGGVGYGIDRMVMILLGQYSIRDVIPFPMRK